MGWRLTPGMFADVEIVTTVTRDVLVISDKGLKSVEDGQIVFVALGDPPLTTELNGV